MKKSTKILILIIILIFATLVIRSTYSKYSGSIPVQSSKAIAKWCVKVNDTDVTLKTDTNEIKSFTFEKDSYNYYKWFDINGNETDAISPGSLGYFYVILDTKNIKTSIQYRIEIDLTNLANEVGNSKLGLKKIENCKFNFTGNDYVETSPITNVPFTIDKEISGYEEGIPKYSKYIASTSFNIKNYADVKDLNGFRIMYAWDNNEATNDDDLELANKGIKASVKYHLIVEQYKGN